MPLNVYYLDDEQALCDVFRDTYSSDDVHVLTFTDPAALIQQSKKTPPDLAFFDYCLPSTTGDKVAQALDPIIPKVLVTGDTGLVSDYPFVKILYKPWDDQDVLQILGAALDTKNSRIKSETIPEIIASEKAVCLDVGVGHIVHELNTPLAVIKMRAHQLTTLLEKDLLAANIKEEVSRLAGIIEGTVDEMTTSLREMRDAVKMDTAEVSQACDIRESLEIASHIIKRSENQIKLDLTKLDFGVNAICKPQQMIQIFMNTLRHLISLNAVPNPNNKISVTSDLAGGKILIRMSINLTLLPTDAKDEMPYDSLYLFKGSRKTRGLDLAIAEKLAKANRGAIETSTDGAKHIVVFSLISAQEELKKA
jgi:nitrogen fixation/metabolism regulation signal transduction histidine kinase